MNHSTPSLPVHHQLPEFTQTHVRWVSDAIQPSHPLSSPSPPASNLSQHQGLFQWVSSSHEVAKVLEFQLQLNTTLHSCLCWWTLRLFPCLDSCKQCCSEHGCSCSLSDHVFLLIYITPSCPYLPSLPLGNHQFVHYICVSFLLYSLVCFIVLGSMYKEFMG